MNTKNSALNNILEPNNKNVVKKGLVLPSNREGQKFVKRLNNFRDYDKERIYFKKSYEVNQWGSKIYQGYFCYDCHNKLIFINDRVEEWKIEPYRIHKKLLKKGIVNTKYEQKEISYLKALCCQCAEICDCSEYLKIETEKTQQEIAKWEAEIAENKKITNYLKNYEGELGKIKGIIRNQEYELERLEKWKASEKEEIKHLERKREELVNLTTETEEEE